MKRAKRKQKIISIRLDDQTLRELDTAVVSFNARGGNANRGHLIRLAIQRLLESKEPLGG